MRVKLELGVIVSDSSRRQDWNITLSYIGGKGKEWPKLLLHNFCSDLQSAETTAMGDFILIPPIAARM